MRWASIELRQLLNFEAAQRASHEWPANYVFDGRADTRTLRAAIGRPHGLTIARAQPFPQCFCTVLAAVALKRLPGRLCWLQRASKAESHWLGAGATAVGCPKAPLLSLIACARATTWKPPLPGEDAPIRLMSNSELVIVVNDPRRSEYFVPVERTQTVLRRFRPSAART